MAEKIETTIGDRISTGAVNAAVWGGFGAAGALAVNAIRKYAFKTPVKLFGKVDWIITGATAAASGLWAFFTADKSREVAIEKAIDALADQKNTAPDVVKQKQLEKIISDAMDGKPIDSISTKHRDMVSKQREVAASTNLEAAL